MSTVKLTIPGFYEYLKDTGRDLFARMELPDDIKDSREDLIDSILIETYERPVMYEDADFLIKFIGTWSRTNIKRFERVIKLYSSEYDPISNYDRKETRTENSRNSGTYSNSKRNSNDYSESSNSGGSVLNKNYVSAYDSSELSQNAEVNSVTSDESARTGNGSAESEDSGTSQNEGLSSVTIRAYGNIGITTSQAMFKEEKALLESCGNALEFIAKDFAKTFCLYQFS